MNKNIPNENNKSSDETLPSNVNTLNNDQNNQDMFKDWCEEDGDFEVDEVVQQQGDDRRHESQPPQQPNQLDLGGDDGDYDFDQDAINSEQFSSINNDQTTNTTNNDVVGGQNHNVDEDVEASQSSTTKIIQDDTLKFDEEMDVMMTNEIGKIINGNLCTVQNNEVPVQSVLIDQKDVVTLEDEIIKSQSPEKVQKSKQSPQKGKQRKARKSKADTEMLTSAAEDSTIKNNFDQSDQNDLLDSENDSKTKSGRKVQRPEFFNPAEFGHGRRKSSFEQKDLSSEPSKKTKRQTGKRQSRSAKSARKVANVLQESENILSERLSEDKQVLMQDAPENSQILYDPSGIYVDPEEDNIVCVVCHDGTSKKQNWIVFCDNCDSPYHQRCHKPRIDDIYVDDSKTEWICSKCPRSSKRIKIDKKSPEIQEIQEIRDDREQDQELISIGAILTREQKVEYLSSLSQDVLVNLLLLAEQMEPNIPLYPANILGRYATANMSSRDNEMDETNQSVQDTGECLTVDVQTPGLSTAEVSNLSTMEVSPNLNPINIEKGPYQNPPEQDTQQEPITPESSPPSSGLKEITEHSKDSYLTLYIRAMSEIGNPNGSTAQTMHSWIKSNYNVPDNFTARAKKALHYAVNKGIFVKNSRMTYKFNPDYNTFPYNKDADTNNTSGPITEEAVKMGVNVNNNIYDGQKTSYKELTSGLQGGEDTPVIGKHNPPSEIKDFNYYQNQDFYIDPMMDANFLGKSDDAFTATTTSQRSSLSNPGNNSAENNNNNNNNVQYNQTSAPSGKQQPPTAQSQPISSIPKLPANAPIMMNNEQTRTDIRLPPLAPKLPISVLPSIMRSNPMNYQPLQQQRVTGHQNELSIGGGGNDFLYSIIQQSQIFPKSQILPLSRVDNNITRNITTTIISPNYSILMPPVVRGGNQLPQPSQQMFDNTKIRTSSSSIPSLQSLPAIDPSLNGNVNKIRTQLIPLPASTMHSTATTVPTSPQQTWPSSFNPFYMSPQPGDGQFTIFDNTFYDPTQQPQHHHHQQHPSTTSTNDYNNVVINDLQHNDNSLFHRMSGNQQQDSNIIGTSRSSYNLC